MIKSHLISGGVDTKFLGYPNSISSKMHGRRLYNTSVHSRKYCFVVALLLIEITQLFSLHLYRMSSSQTEKKSVALTVAEQDKAARLLRSRTNAILVTCQYGIRRRTAINIKQKCDEIISRVHENAVTFNAKTICTVKLPEVHNAVISFKSTAKIMTFPATKFA